MYTDSRLSNESYSPDLQPWLLFCFDTIAAISPECDVEA